MKIPAKKVLKEHEYHIGKWRQQKKITNVIVNIIRFEKFLNWFLLTSNWFLVTTKFYQFTLFKLVWDSHQKL